MKNTLLQIVLVVATVLTLSAMKTVKTTANEDPKLSLADVSLTKVVKTDRKSTRLNSSHRNTSRMPSSA